MEALFIYIAKSSGLIVLFYCAYYFLLRKETFFNSSRWFLLAGLGTSLILPFIVYTKIIWIEAVPLSAVRYSHNYVYQTIEQESFEINWSYIMLTVYCIGFLALIIKFAGDFISLNSVLKGKKVQQQADFKFVDITENIAPFSYFDYIVYNSSMYTEAELENIIEHEKVHSDQHHTIDVLISRLFCVLFWFNPFIWLYKKAILQNLEFIADHEAAKNLSDKKAYQYTLLKITTHENCVAITNHFYQSLIKKRIVMLNKNQSNKRNHWKYYAILPALAVFVFLFQVKTIAQEKKEALEIPQKLQSVDVYKITNKMSDNALKELKENLKEKHNVDLQISKTSRNSDDQLTAIKIVVKKENGKSETFQVKSTKPIQTCGVIISTQEDGSKKVNLVNDNEINAPLSKNHNITSNKLNSSPQKSSTFAYGSPLPPTPPTPPVIPAGAMYGVPGPDMSKMPKPPVPPANSRDKAAMSKFEKEMEEFEKKMEAFEPDMSAYEKQVEEIMSKREAILEKEMKKYERDMVQYEIAMEKFSADMEKFAREAAQQMTNGEQD
jgi:hypothetical protein